MFRRRKIRVLRDENLLENIAQKVIKIDNKIEERAKYFENLGVQAFDALHLACAEENADVFLTVDNKRFKNKSKESLRMAGRGVLWKE